jgi:hypothetical protein
MSSSMDCAIPMGDLRNRLVVLRNARRLDAHGLSAPTTLFPFGHKIGMR